MDTMDRIRDELAKAGGDQAIEEIGEYVTRRVAAGADVPKGKTLQGAFSAMKEWARKNQKNGYCCVPPEKAYELVDKYFGFSGEATQPAPASVRSSVVDELDLDALLGV